MQNTLIEIDKSESLNRLKIEMNSANTAIDSYAILYKT